MSSTMLHSGLVKRVSLQLEVFESRVVPATLSISLDPTSIPEDAGAGAVLATITRDEENLDEWIINLSSSDTSEATLPDSVVLPAGETTVTVLIDIVDDDETDGDQTVTIFANTSDLEASADLTVQDNDFGPQPPLAADDTYSLREDDPLQVTAPGVLDNDLDADTPLENLTIELVSNVSNGTLTLNPDGSFTYIPNADFNGEDTFQYRIFDGQFFSDPATVRLQVSAVNDAPVFTLPTNSITITENSGPQTRPGFLTDLAAGPATATDELATQTVSIEVTVISTSGSLTFTDAPTIAADGTLSFTTAMNTHGSATVRVVVRDNGGTEDGGVDTSVAQFFTIQVDPVVQRPGIIVNGTDLIVTGSDRNDFLFVKANDKQDGSQGVTVFAVLDGQWINQTFNQPIRRIIADMKDGADAVIFDDRLKIAGQITGGLGNDYIRTAKGNDVVYADLADGSGDGHDVVDTGNGDDFVNLGHGNNFATTGNGDDTIIGGSGIDVILAGNGNDFVDAGAGNDYVFGGKGQDVLLGGLGDDHLDGGAGKDLLIGGPGQDFLAGGHGHDILVAGTASATNAGDSLRQILTDFNPKAASGTIGSYEDVRSRLTVTDDGEKDHLFGQNGTDFFFSVDLFDYLDRKPKEKRN